jgi:hypothetical protein
MSKEKIKEFNFVSLDIDLSDLAVEDVKLFLEEGSRGLSDFGASCSCCGTSNPGPFSCAPTPTPEPIIIDTV